MSELNAIKFSDSNLIWMGITCILLFFLPLLYDTNVKKEHDSKLFS